MLSPINSFDIGSLNQSMQQGMQMGAVNSPLTPLGQALKGTLDKYQALQTAQQGQQDKLGLLQKEYDLKKGMAAGITDPDAAGPFTQVDLKTGKSFYRSTTIGADGTQKVSWAPVSPNAPEDLKKMYMDKNVWGPLLNEGEQQAPNAIQQGAGVQPQVTAPVVAAPVPQAGGQRPPAYDPKTQKLQFNPRTQQYRVVPLG